jgi:hypothetical protein
MFGTAFASTPFASQSEIRFLIDGVGALGATNSVTISADANVPVTTPSLTSSVGSVVVVAEANTAITGVSATASTNTVTVTAAANVVPTGVDSTGVIGTTVVVAGANTSISSPALTVGIGVVTITAAANVVLTGVSATSSLGLIQNKTTNVIPITSPALTVNTNSVTVANTNFDYESLQDSYDRKRVVFITGTPQNFTVVIPSDKKQRTVSIAAIDRDNTIRIAA